MKRSLTALILCLAGIPLFAQNVNVSGLLNDYKRQDGTFAERYEILEIVRDSGSTGIGEFYHEALKFLILRLPDIVSRADQDIAERSAVIVCQGIGAEKYSDASHDLWQTVEAFDVTRPLARTRINFEGQAMQAALTAIGQVDARNFVPAIVQRLNQLNSETFRDPDTRRRIQRAVVGCISALETFKDISGYRPVFYVYMGSYDGAVKTIASNALPNITDDPSDVIIEIIMSSSSNPPVKLEAWKELLRTRAPDESKARAAAAALSTGWTFATTDRGYQASLREMRKGAIDIIRECGVANDSVYADLKKSYSANFISDRPDNDEVMLTLNALGAIGSDQAVSLLYGFLQELNARRRSGPWGNKERMYFEWVVLCIGATGTKSPEVVLLLTTIHRNSNYTRREQSMAERALNQNR